MNNNNLELVRAEGTIEHTGITTYMYGNYKLVRSTSDITYALRSSNLDLKEYVGHYVEITGTRVPEYPLEGGPIYLDVETVTARYKLQKYICGSQIIRWRWT